MGEPAWSATDIREFERWYLDEAAPEEEELLRRLRSIPAATRPIVRDHLLVTIHHRRLGLVSSFLRPGREGCGSHHPDCSQKLADLSIKEWCLVAALSDDWTPADDGSRRRLPERMIERLPFTWHVRHP